jgi:hypothetical protein
VRGLKEWVSSSGRGGIGGEQVTDEVVGEKMQWVGNALQNWVIVNFRRAKMGRLYYSTLHLSVRKPEPTVWFGGVHASRHVGRGRRLPT